MHIYILSNERAFAHMLELELTERGHSVTCGKDANCREAVDVYLIDRDAFPAVEVHSGRVAAYSRTPQTGEIRRPFSLGTLFAVIEEAVPARGLSPVPGGVLLHGRFISLSPREAALLACLLEAKGCPVSRETLFSTVWGGEGDDGVVTVYLHYLRKKLEKNGQKMLYAVRGRGYALREEETV